MTARDIVHSTVLWMSVIIIMAATILGMQAAGIIRDPADWTGSGSVEEFIVTLTLFAACGLIIGRFSPGPPFDVAKALVPLGIAEVATMVLVRGSGDVNAMGRSALFGMIFCAALWTNGWIGVRMRSPPLP